MSLNNLEKVVASLPDVQSMEIQILEEENYAKVQQKFNTSTCCVCNKDAKDKYIFCSECYITFMYITDASFVDDNTTYTTENSIEEVNKKIRERFKNTLSVV